MTELEPAVIGDELLRERVAATDEVAPGGAYAHWLGGSEPVTLAGTTTPGDVHLAVCQESWTSPEVPPLDLSWTPTDPYEALDEILERHGARDIPRAVSVVTLEEVAGILGPNWTAGMDSVRWVQAQRDDDPDLYARDAAELEATVPDEPAPTVQVSVTRYDPDAGHTVEGWPENWPTQELKAITEEEK